MKGWRDWVHIGQDDDDFVRGMTGLSALLFLGVPPFYACAAWAPGPAWAAVWIWMISPFFTSILAWTSLICASRRVLRQYSQQRKYLSRYQVCRSHLLADKLQAALDGALGVAPVCLEQDGADQFVDGLAVLELGELLRCAMSTLYPACSQKYHEPFGHRDFPAFVPRVFASTARHLRDLQGQPGTNHISRACKYYEPFCSLVYSSDRA